MKKLITARANPIIKGLVDLQDGRIRRKKGLFLVEGKRAIETMHEKFPIQELFCTEKTEELAKKISQKAIVVSVAVMQKISTANTPSGLVATFKIPRAPEVLTTGLVLAHVSDPGNMGTLIRTAVACGMKSVVIIEGSDPWSPKVVQASAGTIGHISVFQWNWDTLMKNKKGFRLAALVVKGGKGIDIVDPKKTLLVVGGEATGIPEESLKKCDQKITLPMPGDTESLNAAVAGSIAMYLAFVKD